MPNDLSINVLQKTFPISERTAQRAKDIQKEHGILSTPNPKPGKRLTDETWEQVVDFYHSDTTIWSSRYCNCSPVHEGQWHILLLVVMDADISH